MSNADKTLTVSEVFLTIQGEAIFTGTPSVFIRMQGCDVGCSFCDTKYTWKFNSSSPVVPAKDVVGAKRNDTGYRVRVDDLVHTLRSLYPRVRHYVLTGGEPAAQPIGYLLRVLNENGNSVQIETSGTYDIPDSWVETGLWITCSPKLRMPGGRSLVPATLLKADEFKFPIGKQSDLEKIDEVMAIRQKSVAPESIWLQPISQSKNATQLCVDTCYLKGYRLSVQTHKYIGLE